MDFKTEDFYNCSTESFEKYYGINYFLSTTYVHLHLPMFLGFQTFTTLCDIAGPQGDGNVYNPANVTAFVSHVILNTEGQGVHLMVADGVSFFSFLLLTFSYPCWTVKNNKFFVFSGILC